jgi:thymidylate synthase (FAD)
MTSIAFEIKTSRAVARQLIRHKSLFFQEFSQRYMNVKNFEKVNLRKQADKNRQSSTVPINEEIEYYTEDGATKIVISMDDLVSYYLDEIKNVYNILINNGVSKESARFILPECAESTVYVHGTIRSFYHYFSLRMQEDTQLEHRELAEEMFKIFREEYPILSELIKPTETKVDTEQ